MPRSDTYEPRKAKRRRLLRPAAAVAVAAVAVAGVLTYHMSAGSSQPQYRFATVARGTIESTVTAAGSLEPKDYVDVGVQVSGQLRTVHVKIGDRVEKGQLLAEIDPTVYRTRVEADRAKVSDLVAQLAQQKAELALARLQAERQQRLSKANATSQDAVDSAVTAVEVGEARIRSLQAQLDQARSTLAGDEANLGYTKIYAPMTGTVMSQTTLQGQTINANQSAPIILQIADLQSMTVRAKVAEADIVKISPGMEVYFTTLGDLETRWPGRVRQILPSPEVVNDVVLFNVLVDVANPEGRLMSKMTAQVFFVRGIARDVPIVPVAALRPKNGAWVAQVAAGEGVAERRVVTGLMTRTEAEVMSGLEVGDKVVIGTARNSDAPRGGNNPLSPLPRPRA